MMNQFLWGSHLSSEQYRNACAKVMGYQSYAEAHDAIRQEIDKELEARNKNLTDNQVERAEQ